MWRLHMKRVGPHFQHWCIVKGEVHKFLSRVVEIRLDGRISNNSGLMELPNSIRTGTHIDMWVPLIETNIHDPWWKLVNFRFESLQYWAILTQHLLKEEFLSFPSSSIYRNVKRDVLSRSGDPPLIYFLSLSEPVNGDVVGESWTWPWTFLGPTVNTNNKALTHKHNFTHSHTQ